MKKRIISAVLAAAIAFAPMMVPNAGVFPSLSVTAEAAVTVKTPSASLKSGTYCVSSLKKVTLSCKTKGAEIWYSVNGGKYKKYSKPLSLSKNTTLKFYAKYGSSKSKTVTCKYKFTPKVTITPDGGTVSVNDVVKAKSSLSDVKLYYTLDGSKPTKSSKVFPKSGIKIDKDCTLRILAVKSGFTSKYYSADFTSSGKLTIGKTKSILNDYTRKYYYQNLNDRQRQIYRDLWNGITNHSEKIRMTLDDVQGWEINYVWWLFEYENPQFFWADLTTYNYTYIGDINADYTIYEVIPSYYITGSAEEKRIGAIIEKQADEIIDLALKESTDYDALASIYASVNRITEYYCTDKDPECNIVGPFVNGKAQCEGYAMAMMYLCQSVGIPSVFVAGMGGDEKHGWNKVEIDGKWYQLDATWDDNGESTEYGYFCVSDKQMAANHKIETWMPMEGFAAVTDNNHYKYLSYTVYDNADDAYKALMNQAAENFKNGNYTTSVYCDDDIVDAVCEKVYSNSIDYHNRMGVYYESSSYRGDYFPAVETGRITLFINP